jgi:NTE family protein
MGDTSKYYDGVFEGGGMKGIGLAGAIAVLEEEGHEPQNLAGASAGAITAAALAAGYSASELKEIILDLDFRRFQDRAWEDKLPVLEKSLSTLLDLGIYEGDAFLAWMRELLAAKGVTTFRDLVHPEYETDPQYRYRLQVIASDITKRRLLVLPRDAAQLGVEPDDLNVALAVRMSMSIPVFFEPVRWQNPKTGEAHLIVDGGMLSNFPVWLFDCRDGEDPEWPTFGMLLVEPSNDESIVKPLPEPVATRGPKAVLEFVRALAHTMMQAHDRLYVDQANYARTIPIKTLGVATTDFDLSRDRALKLYDSGRRAADDFLQEWDFEAYLEAFRRGKQKHSRREALLAAMKKTPVA